MKKDKDAATALTPVPKEAQLRPRTMDFPDAIRAIMDGKKVTRVSWGNQDYGVLKDGWLSIFTKGSLHTWQVSDGDMLEAEDWTIVNETN